MTLLIVSLIKLRIVSIRSWFVSSVLSGSESGISASAVCSGSESVVCIVFSWSEICNSLIKRDRNLVKSILTWDGIVVKLLSCSPWIWSCEYKSDLFVVNICSFSSNEEVWSAVFDTTSSTVSLTAIDGFVIVSGVVSTVDSVPSDMISSPLFWSIVVVVEA